MTRMTGMFTFSFFLLGLLAIPAQASRCAVVWLGFFLFLGTYLIEATMIPVGGYILGVLVGVALNEYGREA